MILGLIQNDASLMPCRIRALRETVDITPTEQPDALGAGFVLNSQALVRKRPGSADVASDPLGLVEDVNASAVIVHVRRATVGSFKEENTHPFRYKSWLFAHGGTVAGFGDLRPALLEGLPAYLKRAIAGETDSEHVFSVFLAQLKELGILETLSPSPEVLATAMARTVRTVEALAEEVGAGGQSTLNLLATNGRSLVAVRRGARPLYWAVLDGLERCALHDLEPDAPETHPMRMPHRHLRAVVVTSGLAEGAAGGWRALDDGQILATGQDFAVRLMSLPT